MLPSGLASDHNSFVPWMRVIAEHVIQTWTFGIEKGTIKTKLGCRALAMTVSTPGHWISLVLSQVQNPPLGQPALPCLPGSQSLAQMIPHPPPPSPELSPLKSEWKGVVRKTGLSVPVCDHLLNQIEVISFLMWLSEFSAVHLEQPSLVPLRMSLL